LSGGTGSRLSPLTKSINKHLLPLYDKPIIFYSISTLMLAGIREILIITNPEDKKIYEKLFSDARSRLGLKLKFETQDKPNGIPEAFNIGANFIKKSNVALILGDNFFYGQGFTDRLRLLKKRNKGATIFLYPVKNPKDFGVAVLKKKKIIKIVEKPKKDISNLAITGLYFFDNNVCKYSKTLKKSKRNETEITDLLNKYLKKGNLQNEFLGRGSAWLDTGTYENLMHTSNFVYTIEKRQGLKIGCLEEIALNNGWISFKQINKAIEFYGKCDYSNYLKRLIQK
jgi:glucose-1-phosphate thymidylyltransferase